VSVDIPYKVMSHVHNLVLATAGWSASEDKLPDFDAVQSAGHLETLRQRVIRQPLTIWATLREDTYESFFGDGYYAYVERVFLRPTEAAASVESSEERMVRLHIRRFDLSGGTSEIVIRPGNTEREPITPEIIANKLAICGLLATL
jgi:hypothetical protein